jgi:hypothetical protein
MELNSRFAEDHQSDDDLGLGKCLRLAAYFSLALVLLIQRLPNHLQPRSQVQFCQRSDL